MDKITEQQPNVDNIKKDFQVCVYSIFDVENMSTYCHWSEGLHMLIIKDGVQIKLESDEIEQLVSKLPRTIGGTY